MTRLAGWVAALLLVLLGIGCSPGAARPDILLVVVDTLRADHVGVYGAVRPTTPSLDALAKGGVVFRRAHSHSGWTLPAMASLLTGRLPHEHGMGRDPKDLGAFGKLPADVPTLAELLGDAGYDCGAVVNNTFLAPSFGFRRGFGDDYDYVGAGQDEIRSAETSVDAALQWIEHGDRPYFFLLHLMEPHMWYAPPASVRGTFAPVDGASIPVPFTDAAMMALQSGQVRLNAAQLDALTALYDEEILAVDHALGRLFAALRRSPRWASTVVVVTADHGEGFGDHGLWEHGNSLYGELTHVPLIVRGPGIAPGEVTTLVQHADVFRTILSFAGVAPPAGSAGRPLLPATPPPVPVVVENVLYGEPQVGLVEPRYAAHWTLPATEPEVWELDDAGIERRRLSGEEAKTIGARLQQELLDRRGSLDPLPVQRSIGIHTPSELEQLRSLGYVGRGR